MSRIIKVDGELLLYALKYSITNNDIDKDRIIKSIIRNIDDLSNDDLKGYIEIIRSNKTVEAKDSEYTWSDLKEALEKEVYVRDPVKNIMDKVDKL